MIWSVSELRAFDELAGVSDARLALMEQAVEDLVRGATGNPFVVRGASYDAFAFEGGVAGAIPAGAFAPGDTVLVTESDGNDGLHQVTSTTDGVWVDPQTTGAGRLRATLVRYPAAVRMGALQLLIYRARRGAAETAGIQSETISRHSVSYALPGEGAIGGFPPELTAFLTPFRRAQT